MKYIPFFPLFKFIRIVIRYGGLSGKGWLHVIQWMLKLTLLEPLRWVEAICCDYRINHTELQQHPVFIIGHYRSGTTFMQRILACDTRYGGMTAFDQVAPDLMQWFEKPLVPVFQKVSDMIKAYNHFHRVPYDWSFPGEEDLALMAMISYYSPTWAFLFPAKFKTILDDCFHSKNEKRLRAWRTDYVYLLKKLSLKNKGKPLVLKSPPHTARVAALATMFPEARFIYLSRDPYDLYASTQRLWDVIIRLQVLGTTHGLDREELVYSTIELFHQKWNVDKKDLRPEQWIEIRYEDLLKQPLDVMKQIYSHLHMPDFSICEPDVKTFLELQKVYKTQHHELPAEVREKISNRLSSTMS